jgi:hypothetical protein
MRTWFYKQHATRCTYSSFSEFKVGTRREAVAVLYGMTAYESTEIIAKEDSWMSVDG